jgi:hypothetical protein
VDEGSARTVRTISRAPELDARLVDVKAVAAYLSVDASWVYGHANELGVHCRTRGMGARLPARAGIRESPMSVS